MPKMKRIGTLIRERNAKNALQDKFDSVTDWLLAAYGHKKITAEKLAALLKHGLNSPQTYIERGTQVLREVGLW